MWRNMKNKTIILLTIPVIAITMTSCGTIAGVGKDIQSVGRTMERYESWTIRLLPKRQLQRRRI